MNLTSTEIFKLVWDRIRDSLLGKTVPMMYADHYPNNPSGEFIVVVWAGYSDVQKSIAGVAP